MLTSAKGQGRARRLHAARVRRARAGCAGARRSRSRPFERILARVGHRARARAREGGGTRVTPDRSAQRPRGFARFGGVPGAPRHARQLDGRAGRPRAAARRGWRRELMRWWGWGEDERRGRAARAPRLALLRAELGVSRRDAARAGGARGGAPARARAAGAARAARSRRRRRRARARRPRGARGARRRARATRTWCGCARATARARPTRWSRPARPTQVAAVLDGLRREPAWRWCRSAAAPAWWAAWSRCARARRAPSRSTCGGWTACSTSTAMSLTATLERGPASGPRLERRLGEHGPDARPLPAVVRVLDRRRLGGHPLGRPGLDRLRAHRRAGGGRALRDARPASSRTRDVPGHRRRARRCASCSWARRACSA